MVIRSFKILPDHSNSIAVYYRVVQQSLVSGKRSVANLSLGGGYSSALNDAVNAAVAANVPQVVAAGNSNRNACSYSPASATDAVTVGATEISDSRASYSNYGACLDIFGPGTDIMGAWIDSVVSWKTLSGTSMASPHVAGVVAKYLSLNSSLSAYDVTAQLVSYATVGVVKNESGGDTSNPDNLSPDLIVFGNCTQP
jgi:subtilisin family serine protease